MLTESLTGGVLVAGLVGAVVAGGVAFLASSMPPLVNARVFSYVGTLGCVEVAANEAGEELFRKVFLYRDAALCLGEVVDHFRTEANSGEGNYDRSEWRIRFVTADGKELLAMSGEFRAVNRSLDVLPTDSFWFAMAARKAFAAQGGKDEFRDKSVETVVTRG